MLSALWTSLLSALHSRSFRRVIGTLLVIANVMSSTGMVLAKEASEEEDPSETSYEETTASDTSSETSSQDGPTEIYVAGEDYLVNVSYGPETGIPADAELVVNEVTAGSEYDEYYQQLFDVMDEDSIGSVRFFDISLMKDGVELEPAEGTSVSVTITLMETLTEEISVVHLPDNEEVTIVENEATDNGEGTEVSFEAEGFSAYAIVKAPPHEEIGWHKISTLAELKAFSQSGKGLYIRNLGTNDTGYYFTNKNFTVNSSRTGIEKTYPNKYSTPPEAAKMYYFELVPGTEDQFYVYCFANDGTTKRYVHNNGANSLYLSDESEKTAFTAEVSNNGNFMMRADTANGPWYWNMQGGDSGKSFCSYNVANDGNNKMIFQYHDVVTSDPYSLDGQSYGLMYYVTGLNGKALMTTSSDGDNLDAQTLTVMQKQHGDSDDKLFVPQDSDLPFWKFEWVADDTYYVSTVVDGGRKYLKIDGNGVYLVEEASKEPIKVVTGSGKDAGKIRLMSQNGNTLGFSGNSSEGFVTGGSGSYLYMVLKSDLPSDYVKVYSAKKISASDIQNGQKVIVYTRVWNEDEKQYHFYAVDKDGKLVDCFEEGDAIQWVGKTENTLLWDFTDYGAGHYYELYNESSGKYIAPQLTDGQILSNNTIGIHLDGRESGQYGTTIKAWDDPNYAFAQLAANSAGTSVISKRASTGNSTPDEKEEFFFAIVEDLFEDELETVPTIDNNTFGIKMYLVDFSGATKKVDGSDTTVIQDSIIKGSGWNSQHPHNVESGLLSDELDEYGYPTATKTNQTLKNLFDPDTPNENISRREVNHLFLESTYNSSGYFVFDSSQNYAYFDTSDPNNKNFVVYQELGTFDTGNNTKTTMKHGQFLPYNDLLKDQFSVDNPINQYSIEGPELDHDNPRYGERLHLVQYAPGKNSPNHFFGIEMETSFVQTPSGQDDWGHDIIYEFTGDDDFWLYVDGELVLDLGGIHSAVYGKVNFCTGEVWIQDQPKTTLKDIFFSNFCDRMTEAEAEAKIAELFEYDSVRETWTFKDYTFHTMKVFYMERGGGASNLKMKFNQASIKPETILFGKEIEGSKTTGMSAEFPFQIYYAFNENTPLSEYKRLDPEEYQLENPELKPITVKYRGTNEDVRFEQSHTFDSNYPDGTYEDVFFLRVDELCEIEMPDGAIMYYVKECAVDPDIYSDVKVNGKTTGVTITEHTDTTELKDYEIAPMPVKQRTKITYTNVVNQSATQTLTFTKWLYNEDQSKLIIDDETTFDFRLYLDLRSAVTTVDYDSMKNYLAYMQEYSIRDTEGNYCKWDATTGRFVPLGDDKNDYEQLTDAEKAMVTFQTSANGMISKVPAFYTVEIRDLMSGTNYMVEERDGDLPDGYGRIGYQFKPDYEPVFQSINENTQKDWSQISTQRAVWGTTVSGDDPHIDIKNVKGYGIRANKIWVDDPYMAERAPAYFAVYTRNENTGALSSDPITGTVKQLKFGEDSVYWFFETLPAGSSGNLNNCVVREVTITNQNPTVLYTGVVQDPGAVTPIDDGRIIQFTGKLKGDTESSNFNYTVTYQQGSLEAGQRVRLDDITNDRYGMDLYKYEWYENESDVKTPLAGAEFVLEAYDGSVRIGPFTSDEAGHITTAFLKPGVSYTLIETKVPQGYRALPSNLTITLDPDGKTVNVTGPDGYYYKTNGTETVQPRINIKNQTYKFQVRKVDDSGAALDGVKFSLHKWKVVGGVGNYESDPMPGYEAMVSANGGIVSMPDDWNTLPAGTYALIEDEEKAGYQKISYPIRFTITETGEMQIEGVYEEGEVTLTTEEVNGEVRYTLTVMNKSMATLKISKTVEGNFGSKTQQFNFSVTLLDEFKNPITGSKTVKFSRNATTSTLNFNSNGTANFTLAHGESIEIYGLKQGAQYTVTETASNGYKVKYCEGEADYNAGTFTTGNIVRGIIGERTTNVFFVNTKNGILPTGLDFSCRALLGAALLLVVGGSSFVYLGRRRKETEKEEENLKNV